MLKKLFTSRAVLARTPYTPYPLANPFSSSTVSNTSWKDAIQRVLNEHMTRQRIVADAQAAALITKANADAAALLTKANADAAAVMKTADADAAAVMKAADADVVKKTADAAAVMKTANQSAKTKEAFVRIAKYTFWGGVGLTTIAFFYVWLDWLYYDSTVGLKWHIKRFLKKSNKYKDPRKNENRMQKVLPVLVEGARLNLADSFNNEQNVLAALDKICREEFPC